VMKILEAERWLKGTNSHGVAFLQRQGRKTAGIPHPGAWKVERHDAQGSAKTWSPFKGVTLLLKATLPTCVPSRRGLSLLQHAPRSSPYGAGTGSHTSCKPAQSRRSQTAARGACNRPAVTSGPPLLPRPAGERAGSHAGGMQPRQVGVLLRLPTRLAWRPRPTRHATSAPDAACEQLHRHPRHCHASSTAEPVPRLEETLRMTQQRQPGTMVNAAKNGPAVMAVAGGQGQRSRRQPGLRPIRGQRENPLSRREDDAPVFRSSNGSRTRDGRPANRTPRRINSAAGKAAPLAGEASGASPSP
jgi:hypothetical protein